VLQARDQAFGMSTRRIGPASSQSNDAPVLQGSLIDIQDGGPHQD
jgi:hypothetical protein